MELSVMERLLLLEMLPAEGDVTTLRILLDLRRDLSFSEQEHAAIKLVQDNGRVTWDRTQEKVKDVEIGPKAVSAIRDALQKLNNAKKLRETHLSLWDRFMEVD